MDFGKNPVIFRRVDLESNFPFAAMDAFCYFIKRENKRLLCSWKLDPKLSPKPRVGAIVVRPFLAFKHHCSRREHIKNGN